MATKKKTTNLIIPTQSEIKKNLDAVPRLPVFDTPVTISETIKNIEPANADEAFIRIEARKAEPPPGGTPMVDPDAPLPQLFVPAGTVANSAKPAHELANIPVPRPYEEEDTELTPQEIAETRRKLGPVLKGRDGYDIRISADKTKRVERAAKVNVRDTKPLPNDFVDKTRIPDVVFKYDEDETLYNLINYIGQTYSGHYAKNDGLQTLDVWDALGSSVETCRDTAIKYLMRFGQKNGRNQKDLQKAIHYITLMMYFDKKRGD